MTFDIVSIDLTREEYHEFIAYYNDKSTPASPILDKIAKYLLDNIMTNALPTTRAIVGFNMPVSEERVR